MKGSESAGTKQESIVNYQKMTKAELIKALASLKAVKKTKRSPQKEQATLHELQVHQIELEMQNRELVQAQGELEESRNRYAELYDSAPVGYLSIDKQNLIIDINLTGAAMLGKRREVLLGKPFTIHVAHDDLSRFVRHSLECRLTGARASIEVQLRRNGGDSFYAQLISNTASANSEGVLRIAITDITQRKQAENELELARRILEIKVQERTTDLEHLNDELRAEIHERQRTEAALRASEIRYRDLFANTPISIWEEDFTAVGTWLEELRATGLSDLREYLRAHPEAMREAVKLLHIRDVNRATLDMLAAPSKAKLIANLTDRFTESTYRAFAEQLLAIWEGRNYAEIELVGRTLENERIDCILHWAAPVVNDQLDLSRVIVAFANITARKRAEAELEEERALLAKRVEERTAELLLANQELARASRLKDEFLANMSHELRTPLNAILGMSEMLQEQVYGALSEKQLRAIHNIEESGNHLLALINDILDLSKIEAGSLTLEMGPVDVEAVGQASLRLLAQAAHKKQLKFSSRYVPKGMVIQSDERRLKEILVNLLSNAVKFTPAGGRVGLEVTGDPENRMVHFEVWDTGIGIAPENQERLFQSFVQLDSSLAREYGGTGLGLALVKRLVDLHEGTVKVESVLGKGSRFIVALPWSEPVIAAADSNENTLATSTPEELISLPEHGGNNAGKHATILVAEDSESSLDVLHDFLSDNGYQVVMARSGNEALELAQSKLPDLILMDIQMPGMNGFEVIRQIRANENLKTVPIIAMTALAMYGDREHCLEAGANDYISKPLSLKILTRVIDQLLRQRSAAQQISSPPIL